MVKKAKKLGPEDIGPSGDYPRGKLDKDDEGGLMIGIAYDSKHNVIRIEFGKPVAWLAFSPEEATDFARLILSKLG